MTDVDFVRLNLNSSNIRSSLITRSCKDIRFFWYPKSGQQVLCDNKNQSFVWNLKLEMLMEDGKKEQKAGDEVMI